MSNNSVDPIASRFLFLANLLNTVRIEKLIVPEMLANDCSSAVLDCQYSGASDDVTVLWFFNGSQVYEWRHGTEPKASGTFDGRLDLSYRLKSADGKRVQKRALRLIELSPDLTGEYTCVVRSRGQEARLSKPMTVYSPEREFELSFSETQMLDEVHILCIAKHLYPRPDLMIEYNKISVIQQQQRLWREGAYFDAECRAVLSRQHVRRGTEVVCRLRIPQVDYTAITKKYLHIGKHTNGANLQTPELQVILIVITLNFVCKFS